METKSLESFEKFLRDRLEIRREELREVVTFVASQEPAHPTMESFFSRYKEDPELALTRLNIALGRIDLTGLKEVLQAIEIHKHSSRAYTFQLDQKAKGWGVQLISYPRSDWGKNAGDRKPITYQLPSPVFKTKGEAMMFLYEIGLPLVFHPDGGLYGVIDNTSESFMFRRVVCKPHLVHRCTLGYEGEYENHYNLMQDLIDAGCTVIDL